MLRVEGHNAECSSRLIWDEENMSLSSDGGKRDTDTIVFLQKNGKDDPALHPGGQMWSINRDGTVSPTQDPSMVLGYGTRKHLAKTRGGAVLHDGRAEASDGVLVLVPHGNARVIVFNKGSAP